MKKLFSVLSIMFISMFSMQASAHTSGKIEQLFINEEVGLVYVYVKGGINNPPECHGSNGDYLSFSLTRPQAKVFLSILSLAFATGKTIYFTTAGACWDQEVSETIRHIAIMH